MRVPLRASMHKCRKGEVQDVVAALLDFASRSAYNYNPAICYNHVLTRIGNFHVSVVYNYNSAICYDHVLMRIGKFHVSVVYNYNSAICYDHVLMRIGKFHLSVTITILPSVMITC